MPLRGAIQFRGRHTTSVQMNNEEYGTTADYLGSLETAWAGGAPDNRWALLGRTWRRRDVRPPRSTWPRRQGIRLVALSPPMRNVRSPRRAASRADREAVRSERQQVVAMGARRLGRQARPLQHRDADWACRCLASSPTLPACLAWSVGPQLCWPTCCSLLWAWCTWHRLQACSSIQQSVHTSASGAAQPAALPSHPHTAILPGRH